MELRRLGEHNKCGDERCGQQESKCSLLWPGECVLVALRQLGEYKECGEQEVKSNHCRIKSRVVSGARGVCAGGAEAAG